MYFKDNFDNSIERKAFYIQHCKSPLYRDCPEHIRVENILLRYLTEPEKAEYDQGCVHMSPVMLYGAKIKFFNSICEFKKFAGICYSFSVAAIFQCTKKLRILYDKGFRYIYIRDKMYAIADYLKDKK